MKFKKESSKQKISLIEVKFEIYELETKITPRLNSIIYHISDCTKNWYLIYKQFTVDSILKIVRDFS